jgi:hypothetical protein
MISSDAMALASMLIALVAAGVSVYGYVKTSPSRMLSRIELGKEGAKLQLNLMRDKLVSLSKEIEQAKQKGEKLPPMQSKTFGIHGIGRAELMQRLLWAYASYPMMSTNELTGLFLDDGLFEDQEKVVLAIGAIERCLLRL